MMQRPFICSLPELKGCKLSTWGRMDSISLEQGNVDLPFVLTSGIRSSSHCQSAYCVLNLDHTWNAGPGRSPDREWADDQRPEKCGRPCCGLQSSGLKASLQWESVPVLGRISCVSLSSFWSSDSLVIPTVDSHFSMALQSKAKRVIEYKEQGHASKTVLMLTPLG